MCLYFDPELQGAKEKALSKQVLEETAYLKEYKQSKTEVDEKIIKKLAKHFDISTDENGCVISYSVSSEKINEKRSLCGHFAMVCCNLPKEEFRKKFDSPWKILDEMRSVRLVRLKNQKEKVSEFVGKQVDIFDEFSFEIPKDCRPVSKKKPKSKV